MQVFQGEEQSNLLFQQNQYEKTSESQSSTSNKQKPSGLNNLTKLFLPFGIYAMLLLLVFVLIFDISYFIDESFIPFDNVQQGEDLQTRQKMKERDNQYKKMQALNEAKYKQLRLIQLEREMIKINTALRSKQPYDNVLMVNQLQKRDNSNIKYWNFDKSTEEKQEHTTAKYLQEDEAYITKIIPKQQKTHFPKIVWMYIEENISAESNLTQILIGNLAEYLQLNGYDFYLIGQLNFRYLISNRHQEQLGFVLVDLWHLAYETNLTKNLKDHTFTIKKHIVSLIMLSEMGGILIDKEIILTQPLDWLEDFKSITLANKGMSQQPNVIGFYHANYTDSLEEIELQGGEKKQVHLYPPLDPYFLAVSKQGKDFISEVLQRYYVLLEFPERIKEIIVKYQLNLKQLTGNDPYYEAIYFAFSWVLRRKQIQLQQAWVQSGKQSLRPLALDHYSIYAINRVYGPLKYRFLFSEVNSTQIYQYLTKIDYDDLSREFGSISYISFIPFSYKMEELADKAAEGERQYQIFRDSFMGKFVYKNFTESWIIEKNPVKQPYWGQNGLLWDSLPKKIWVFSEKRSLIKELCLINILQSASVSNFEVILLTPSNLGQYLSRSTLRSLSNSHSQMRLLKQRILDDIWVELVKLAILNEHGGVWLDLPMFTLESFNWILEIHHNLQVINRNGRLPKALLFYHPIQNGFPFTCQNQCNLRQSLAFETSFLATEGNNGLFIMWLKELMGMLELNEQRFKEKLLMFNISYKQIKNGAELSKITLQYVQAARNHRLGHKSNGKNWALSEFQVWTMSSFSGLDKLKEYTNFDVGFNSTNIYLWSLPAHKISSLLGGFKYLVQISNQSEAFLNQKLQRKYAFQIDPQSLMAQHLMQDEVLEALLANNKVGALQLFNAANSKKQ